MRLDIPIIVEKVFKPNGSFANYQAYSPKLPGCVLCGTTVPEAVHNAKAGIKSHLQAMVARNMPLPDLNQVEAAMMLYFEVGDN